jgi:hypothetical protein
MAELLPLPAGIEPGELGDPNVHAQSAAHEAARYESMAVTCDHRASDWDVEALAADEDGRWASASNASAEARREREQAARHRAMAQRCRDRAQELATEQALVGERNA